MHHSGGKQLKAEIFEIDDMPSASGSGSGEKKSSTADKAFAYDKHLPNFDFENYPTVSNGEEDDGNMSPRIVDEGWSKYEK